MRTFWLEEYLLRVEAYEWQHHCVRAKWRFQEGKWSLSYPFR